MTAITIADLNNAKLDVDHIAEIATSLNPTATDRLGNVKQTMSAAGNAVALTAAGSATAARIAAEAARDAALIQSGVYATEALGRAAVADGVAFKVQGSGDTAAYEYRKVSFGVSYLVAAYPSVAYVDSAVVAASNAQDSAAAVEQVVRLAPTVTLPTLGDCASVTINDAGAVIEAISSGGIRYVEQNGALVQLDLSGRLTSAPNIDVPGIGMASVVYIDELTGTIVSGVTASGALFHVANGALSLAGAASEPVAATTVPAYSGAGADNVHVTTDATIVDLWVVVGQSLGAGTNNDLGDATVSGTAQHVGHAFTFGTGPTPNYATSPTLTTLGNLREVPLNVSGTPYWESICSRFAWTLLDKMQASVARKQKVFVWSTAIGGATFSAISRGSSYWTKFVSQMDGAKTALIAAGYKPRLRGMMVLHGEADTSAGIPRTEYKKTLSQWRQWVEEDARAIFGTMQDTVTVEMLTYQTNRGGTGYFQTPKVAVAQLDANDQNPHTTCVGPVYWVTGDAFDGIHPAAISYARMGEQFAEVAYRRTYSGQSFSPLQVVDSYWLDATHIRVRYTDSVAIESTDDLVTVSTLGDGKGFDFFDGSAVSPTVTSVAVISGAEVEVTLSGASSGKTARLYYACRKTGNPYRVGGHRGGVRSAAAFMTSAVTAQPNYHWAAMQVFNIGEMK